MLFRLISGLTLMFLAFSGVACSKKGLSSLSKALVKPSGGGTRPSSSDATPFLITQPVSNPYLSSDGALSVHGTCRSGAMIRTSGAFSQTTGCAGGKFLLILTAPADGDFETAFEQVDAAGKLTGNANLRWKRDSTLPPTPVIQSPANPSYSSGSTLTLEGTCIPGNRVELSGDHSASLDCQSGSFSFPIQKQPDSLYSFSVIQKNPAGLASGAADFLWFRDSQAPSVPVVQYPIQNPSVSRSDTLTLSGACESGTVVSLRGAETAEVSCVADAFSFPVVRIVDGTFAFEIFQTDLAGNRSPSAEHSWRHDSTLPTAPKITSPSNPHLSNQPTVTLQGECETGALVMITGSASLLATCSNGLFQFELDPRQDGTHSYGVTQSDAAGNVSDETLFVWTRDQVAPVAPQILSPSTSPFLSAADSLEIKGSCENGTTVNIGGEASESVTCAAQAFTFTVHKSGDGTYPYTVSQTDPAGNASAVANLTWKRDASIPAEPEILVPATGNPVSNQNSLVISGNCLTGATVELNGAASVTEACANGTFSFQVQKGMDGAYPFSVRQISQTGVPSSAVSLNWTRDTVAPELPVLSQPTGPEFISNSDSLLISGSCESGATVNLTGDSTFSTSCSTGAFSFVVSKTTDGIYSFQVSQKDLAGNESGLVNTIWKRDATSPGALVITTPASSPFVSGDDTLVLAGSCEPTLMILISDETQTVSESMCSPNGTFQVSVQKTVDGTYPLRLIQKDQAGNLSPFTDFSWTRDTSIPQSPNLVPAFVPTYSNGNSIVISASCDSLISPLPAEIRVEGDVDPSEILNPLHSPTKDCQNGAATFEIAKSQDGVYRFLFTQDNPNTSFSSSFTEFVWVRDTQAPAKVVLLSPSVQPITAPGSLIIFGTCEALATVQIQGAAQLSVPCGSDAQFSALIQKTTDATYDFTLTQKDAAGNTSLPVPLKWIRNSNAIAPPAILSPVKNPAVNFLSQMTVGGSCQAGYSVTMTGGASGQVTCQNNSFSFTLTATTDGSRDYAFRQSIHGVESAPATFRWTRDTVAPTVEITSQPPDKNLEKSVQFAFTASENALTFHCQMDQGQIEVGCQSPYLISSIPNGSHTFTVRAFDAAGNGSAPVTRTWVQASYNTLALYHFGKNVPLQDSSLYSSSGSLFDHSLKSSSTASPTLDLTGKLPTTGPTSLIPSSANQYFNPGSQVLNTLGLKTMTIEGFVKLTSHLKEGEYYTLVSKSGSTTTEQSWELRLRKAKRSGEYQLVFSGKAVGLDRKSVSSSRIMISTTGSSTWNYFAVTWNAGTVSFFFGNTSASSVGNGTIGTVGSATLASTTAPLRIGFGPNSTTNGTARFMGGALDEIRISQMVRPSIAVPSTEFSAD